MTRNKLFLRALLLAAKRTIVRRFPTTIKNENKKNTLLHAMPSDLERVFVGEVISTSLLIFAEDVFSIAAILYETFSAMKTESKDLSVVRRFPTTIKNENKKNTLLHAMPSDLERVFVGEVISTSLLIFAEDVFSIAAILYETFSAMKTESKDLSV